jgi:hypothetical protein
MRTLLILSNSVVREFERRTPRASIRSRSIRQSPWLSNWPGSTVYIRLDYMRLKKRLGRVSAPRQKNQTGIRATDHAAFRRLLEEVRDRV